MPKVTKKLGNNKARAWESLGFAHKKKLCQHFDTTSILILEILKISHHRKSYKLEVKTSIMGIYTFEN